MEECMNGNEGKTTARPYTDKPLLNDPQDFKFAVVPDRTGGERKGYFGKAMRSLNLLRPEFAICVGDLVDGCYGYPTEEAAEKRMREEWDELERMIDTLDMRFYYVVGNHDINLGWPGNHLAHDVSKRVWQERHGNDTYYDFMYKGCHFICLDSMDGRDGQIPVQGISNVQYAWVRNVIHEHADARWTFIFMHMPIDWTSDKWLAFEREINRLDYTVFCGDWHNHAKIVRHGKTYYMIGTCGGCYMHGLASDDLRYGAMDSITLVTVTSNGPVVSNLQLSGIFDDDVQRCATTKGWIENPLDYPDHLTVPDGLDAEGKGDGTYDWHFRHAMILRNGKLLIKPDIVIAGDGIIHRWGSLHWYGDECYPRPPELKTPFFTSHRVLNMGFIGDSNENLLWRIRHGELGGISPKTVVLHIGSENLRAGESPESVVEGIMRNVHAIHAAVPAAAVKVLGPLESVLGDKELKALLKQALENDSRAEFIDLSEEYAQGGVVALEKFFL